MVIILQLYAVSNPCCLFSWSDFLNSLANILDQFSSVAQSCLILCDPMNHSTSGLPVHHQLPEFTRLTSIESGMPSSHLILCRPLLLLPQSLPASESFPESQLFTWGGQSTGVSALASFLRKQHSWIIKGMSSRVRMALKPNSTAYLPLCDTEEVKYLSVLQFTSYLVIMRIKWVDTIESVLKIALSLVCTC